MMNCVTEPYKDKGNCMMCGTPADKIYRSTDHFFFMLFCKDHSIEAYNKYLSDTFNHLVVFGETKIKTYKP